MSTLLLRLAAPMQSWGISSKYEQVRETGREPSKSGVVGLLAAALGRRRDADLSDLNRLRFGVRADQEGQELRDFQMVHGEKDYITTRYYLADACFVVGLESEDTVFLQELEQALRHPVFPLFLGRRSCPPAGPVVLGIRQTDLVTALSNEPWQASEYMKKRLLGKSGTITLRMRADARDGEPGGCIRDVPVSFDPAHRRYGYRNVTEKTVTFAAEHDPMQELR